MTQTRGKYKLRFFIEYGAGSLWSGNDASYEKFNGGPLDETTFSLDGKISAHPKIRLPDHLEKTRIKLIDLYNQSLDQYDPSGNSLWTEDEWENFHKQTKKLHSDICSFLGEEFDVEYLQEK